MNKQITTNDGAITRTPPVRTANTPADAAIHDISIILSIVIFARPLVK